MLKKINYKILLSFILGMIVSSVTVYSAANIIAAKKISYNNSQSHLEANNLQEAIDLLYGNATSYQSLKTDMLNTIYPVGSIYLSTSLSTTSQVATTLGGTWEVFGAGRTIISANSTYPINTTGGSISESYTPAGTNTGGAVQNHTLTVAQIPSHSHTFQRYSGTDDQNFSGHIANAVAANDTGTQNCSAGGCTVTTSSVGSGGAHNHGFTNPTFTGTAATISHMQPYITVYMYKRTA